MVETIYVYVCKSWCWVHHRECDTVPVQAPSNG